jgi:hypothetical protein
MLMYPLRTLHLLATVRLALPALATLLTSFLGKPSLPDTKRSRHQRNRPHALQKTLPALAQTTRVRGIGPNRQCLWRVDNVAGIGFQLLKMTPDLCATRRSTPLRPPPVVLETSSEDLPISKTGEADQVILLRPLSGASRRVPASHAQALCR